MTNVVPDIRSSLIGGQVKSPLKTVQGHVVLLGIETAETQVSEELCIVYPHLEQTSGRGGRRKGGGEGGGRDRVKGEGGREE